MKILVVDDQAFNRELIGLILQSHNFEFCEAENGRHAVEVFSVQGDIDLVLLDVTMPVMDGYAAATAIKQTAAKNYLPIIFVTALDDEAVMARCIASGGDDFILKPISETVLLAKLTVYQRTIELYRQLSENNKKLRFHQQLMEREHNIVNKVFLNNLQQLKTSCDNVRFHVSPMSMFNGDLLLTADSPLGGVYVLLGDFTGHGLAAAIGCLPVSDIFYSMAKKRASVSAIVRAINRKLLELLPSNMFFCAVLMELDRSGSRLTWWNGGMHEVLVAGEDGVQERLHAQHMALGILSNEEFDDHTDLLTPVNGKKIYACTDGVVEAKNKTDELFGIHRLADLLAIPNDDHFSAIIEAVENFHAGEEQSDDIALVELSCRPVSSRSNKGLDRASSAAASDSLPWQISLHLTPAQLRKPTLVREIVKLLVGIDIAREHEDILFTVVTELLSNALEHGLLELDSAIKDQDDGFARYYDLRQQRLDNLDQGYIDLNAQVVDGQYLQLVVTDSGNGFDIAAKKSADEENHARGVALVDSLCDCLEYSNQGRTVSARYRLVG